ATGEARYERRDGRGDQLVRVADLNERTLHEHSHAVGERRCVEEVVRDDDRGQAELAERRAQLGADRVTRVWVECRQGLVEEEYLRSPSEGSREGDALALATRQLARARLCEVGDAEALREAVGWAAEGHVPAHRQVRKQRVVLED